MKDKKKVIVYTEWIDTFEALTDEESGKLIKHFFRYVNNQNPKLNDRLLEMVFLPIKQTLKRDLDKWKAKSLKNSENAKMRWNKNNANAYERIKRNANHADNDNDNDNDITKRKYIKENSFFNFRNELINLGAEEQIVEDWLKVRKEKKASNTETAFRLFVKQLEKSKKEINEVLEICIEHSWKGFKAEWIKNKNNNKQHTNEKKDASEILMKRYGIGL